MLLQDMTSAQLAEFAAAEESKYRAYKAKGMKLDMSRGKPSAQQLDLAAGMLDCVNSQSGYRAADGMDCRNYGGLDGIAEAKLLFAEMLNIKPEEVFVGGNSSLNLMYDAICKAWIFGTGEGAKPWGSYEKIRWICIVPGYDRHFAICEAFGIEMLNVPFVNGQPDMDKIEALVAADETIKGIWCVPMYSNPTGTTYSDETVRRFAALKPAAKDFRIFWDNAYCVHHLTDTPDSLLNIMDECKAVDSEDMVYLFASTSKVTFAGAGLAATAASEKNIAYLKKLSAVQTIGFDKLNQLRHVRFLGGYAGLVKQMKKHAAMIAPKFEVVLSALDKEIAPFGIGSWHKPNGGYFISFDAPNGCAKEIVQLCKEAGVVMTPAGASFPYGKDPQDSNIRIAPTFPTIPELEAATEIFCCAVRLAAAKKLLAERK